MATTTPFPFRDYVAGMRTFTQVGLRNLVNDLIAEYESALGDSDKAGETDTAAYHEGRTEAFADALSLLLEVPHAAWDTYHGRTPDPIEPPVSPAKETPVMDKHEHIPGHVFTAANAFFTRPEFRDGRGYTRTGPSDWYLYSGARHVTLHRWTHDGEHVEERAGVEHAELMRDVSNHLDTLAIVSTTSPQYLMAAAAADLILSDAQTGTSLYAWPTMNRLVDDVLTQMYAEGTADRVTSQWVEF